MVKSLENGSARPIAIRSKKLYAFYAHNRNLFLDVHSSAIIIANSATFPCVQRVEYIVPRLICRAGNTLSD